MGYITLRILEWRYVPWNICPFSYITVARGLYFMKSIAQNITPFSTPFCCADIVFFLLEDIIIFLVLQMYAKYLQWLDRRAMQCFLQNVCGIWLYRRHITVASQWVQWRLKSPAYRLLAQLLVHAQMAENIKAWRYWPLWEESTGDRWITSQMASNAEYVSIWWRHHEVMQHGIKIDTWMLKCIIFLMTPLQHNVIANYIFISLKYTLGSRCD